MRKLCRALTLVAIVPVMVALVSCEPKTRNGEGDDSKEALIRICILEDCKIMSPGAAINLNYVHLAKWIPIEFCNLSEVSVTVVFRDPDFFGIEKLVIDPGASETVNLNRNSKVLGSGYTIICGRGGEEGGTEVMGNVDGPSKGSDPTDPPGGD